MGRTNRREHPGRLAAQVQLLWSGKGKRLPLSAYIDFLEHDAPFRVKPRRVNQPSLPNLLEDEKLGKT